jgi:hypothetical protein
MWFPIAAGPRQSSHSRIRVPQDSSYFTVSDWLEVEVNLRPTVSLGVELPSGAGGEIFFSV